MQTMAPSEEDLTERFERIDERLVDVNSRITKTSEETNRRITEGREETKERFNRVESDIRQLREIDIRDLREGDIREVKQGLVALHSTFNRFIIGAATSWVILMVTILVKG